jgi:hypothetical protein
VANGKRNFIEVNDGGDPFKTTGVINAERYTWTEGEWSATFWDEFA